MLCPQCQVELRIADRQGVEIDYCPKCRGVWLDRGELDKIIDRSQGMETRGGLDNREAPQSGPEFIRDAGHTAGGHYPPQPAPYPTQQPYPPTAPPSYQQEPYQQPYPHRRKRGGFLGDLFDFS